MPTLFILFGFRFFFWSNEHDPIHVHISKGDAEAKYNIESLELVENYGFKKVNSGLLKLFLKKTKRS